MLYRNLFYFHCKNIVMHNKRMKIIFTEIIFTNTIIQRVYMYTIKYA